MGFHLNTFKLYLFVAFGVLLLLFIVVVVTLRKVVFSSFVQPALAVLKKLDNIYCLLYC